MPSTTLGQQISEILRKLNLVTAEIARGEARLEELAAQVKVLKAEKQALLNSLTSLD